MAATLIQQASIGHGGGDPNPDTTLALTGVTAGHTLVLGVSTPSSGHKVTSVTDSLGNIWTKVFEEVSTNADVAQIWVAANVAGGNTTLTITWDASRNSALNLSEWSGLATSFPTPPTGGANTAASTTHPSGTATPSSGTYLACAVLSLANVAATRNADAYTDLANAPSSSLLQNYGRFAYEAGISASTSTGWTTSTSIASAGAIVLLQESSGPVTKTQTLTCSGTSSATLANHLAALRALTASVSETATVAAIKAKLASLSAAVTSVPVVSRLGGRQFSISATVSSYSQIPVALGLAGSVVSVTMQVIGSATKTLTATVTSFPLLNRVATRIIGASVASSATVDSAQPLAIPLTVVVSVVVKPLFWFRRALQMLPAAITSLSMSPSETVELEMDPDEHA